MNNIFIYLSLRPHKGVVYKADNFVCDIRWLRFNVTVATINTTEATGAGLQQNLSVGLVACYNLSDASDSVGSFSGNNTGASFSAGQIGNAAHFASDSNRIDIGGGAIDTDTFSILLY